MVDSSLFEFFLESAKNLRECVSVCVYFSDRNEKSSKAKFSWINSFFCIDYYEREKRPPSYSH